jgi:TetR/AcrR family fatty acid metabolism transcriptional regulator
MSTGKVRAAVTREARVRRLPPEERRGQIVSAVLDVVAEYGVPEATIARIAKAANVSEGTLYVYFDSRREMLLAALESILNEMYRLIDGSDGADALIRLRNIEEAHSREMKAERGLLAYPWFEFIAAGPQIGIRDAVADTHKSAYGHLKKIIEGGKAKGAIRGDVDPDRLAWGFYTVLWAENIACMMGMKEYLDEGHSAYILNLILNDAAS